jgi:acyl dehydratase
VIDYDKVMALPALETVQTYNFRDTILYALGVGVSMNGKVVPEDLKFVYEDGLCTLPTMALIIGYPGFWLKLPQYGVTWQKVLHAEQELRLHASVPVEGTVRSKLTIEDIYDRGPSKGAFLVARRDVYNDADGTLIASLKQLSILRGDGGFGGSAMQPSGAAQGSSKRQPDDNRAADITVDFPTLPGQALLYRLCGDLNPLHADPKIAAEVGYPMPILHGMCSLGFVGRALLKTLCDNEPARFKALAARFSSPVFPGETIRTEIWRQGAGQAVFRARVLERDIVIMKNARFEYEE